MIKFTTCAALAASAFCLSVGAFAATAQPATGNQPYVAVNMSQTSTLQRGAVQAAAATNAPASGMESASSAIASSGPALTRAQVHQQTLAAAHARHGFANASGLQNANF